MTLEVFSACALVLALSACSGADGGQAAPPEESEPTADGPASPAESEVAAEPRDPNVTAIQLMIDGVEGPLGGQALLTVHQDIDDVELGITGTVGPDDFVVIDLVLPVVADAMGEHHSSVSRPLSVDSDNVINASLEGEDYYSRLGAVDFSLSADGTIEGTFSVSLASADDLDPFFPVFQGEEAKRLVGTFEGNWLLSCYSRLPGHETWVMGGNFCAAFEF